MPKQKRQSTAYSGVYFVELADDDKSFFIRYKQNGKSFEERAGRSSHGWNAEKASFLRKELLSGVNPLGRYSCNSSGQMGGENNWTFSKIFEVYLRLRPDLKGRENDIYRFSNYLLSDFGNRRPSEVVPGDIEKLRQKLQNQKFKPATVRHILELLRRLANYSFKKKFCPGLSFKIKMPVVENQKTENLTKEQLETLLRVLDEEPDKQVSNIVRLVLYTGLRRGEIFSLKWNDIDFYGKTITIRSKKNEKCIELPMNDMAENVLSEHAHSEVKSEFVFPGRGGKKRTECKRPLLRIKKNARLPDDFRLLQGLRHVYASMLASSGEVDMETLQTLLTHKSSLMTQRYAHLREDALKNSDELEELVINNVTVKEDLKKNEQEIISEYVLESSESVKSEEAVEAAGKLFGDDLSEVDDDYQHTEILHQSEVEDDADEALQVTEHLQEDGLVETEAELQEQETENVEVDVDPIKLEVDMDEILSAEELKEATLNGQVTYFKDHIEKYDYANEVLEENEHLQDELVETEEELLERESDYAGLDVDPIKLEVDMDEIVSSEELIELTEELQVYKTIAENKDTVFNEKLTADPSENVKNMKGEMEEVDCQDYSEETVGNFVSKENLIIDTEVEEEISGIYEDKEDSVHAGETHEDGIQAKGTNLQTNDEQVIEYNYWVNEEIDTVEESNEVIETCKDEFSEQDDGSQINYFTAENTDRNYSNSEKQQTKSVEIESDDFNRETETVDCMSDPEEEAIKSIAAKSLDDDERMLDSPSVNNVASECDNGEEENDNREAASSRGGNKVKISENTKTIHLSAQNLDNNDVFLSKIHQNTEIDNSLRDVKIGLELKSENEVCTIYTDSSSRSSILELKKELMSLSELIKSNPAKVKNSNEFQNP